MLRLRSVSASDVSAAIQKFDFKGWVVLPLKDFAQLFDESLVGLRNSLRSVRDEVFDKFIRGFIALDLTNLDRSG